MRCLLFLSWCCGVNSSRMSPSLLYLKPLRNSDTFLHVIYKSKKKTNLLCILNNVFQYSKIRTRKRNAKKSIKTEKIWNPALFGIRNPVLGIRNPLGGIQNPGLSWIPLHGANYGWSLKRSLNVIQLFSVNDGDDVQIFSWTTLALMGGKSFKFVAGLWLTFLKSTKTIEEGNEPESKPQDTCYLKTVCIIFF